MWRTLAAILLMFSVVGECQSWSNTRLKLMSSTPTPQVECYPASLHLQLSGNQWEGVELSCIAVGVAEETSVEWEVHASQMYFSIKNFTTSETRVHHGSVWNITTKATFYISSNISQSSQQCEVSCLIHLNDTTTEIVTFLLSTFSGTEDDITLYIILGSAIGGGLVVSALLTLGIVCYVKRRTVPGDDPYTRNARNQHQAQVGSVTNDWTDIDLRSDEGVSNHGYVSPSSSPTFVHSSRSQGSLVNENYNENDSSQNNNNENDEMGPISRYIASMTGPSPGPVPSNQDPEFQEEDLLAGMGRGRWNSGTGRSWRLYRRILVPDTRQSGGRQRGNRDLYRQRPLFCKS